MAMVAVGTLATALASAPAGAVTRTSGVARSHHQSRVPKKCRRHRNAAVCNAAPATESVTGSSGTLTVTFTATVTGTSVSFAIASSDSQSYGALGPEVLDFGNGTDQGFATPEYCLANPAAETNDTTASTTYATGSYTASVTVGANCTPDQLTLSLPITVD
jgi:hypothetical protein